MTCRKVHMDLLFGPDHDIDHRHIEHGAYEWWYVDALSPDGAWGVVMIVFRGMPMSPAYLQAQHSGHAPPHNHCGYAVSAYHHGRRVAFAFREVPESAFCVPDQTFEIDTTLPDQTNSLVARVTTQESPLRSKGSYQADHAWVLVAPRVQATVELSLREHGVELASAGWTGLAYRDHNTGRRPLQADFKDWYWGRVHGPDRTLVYLLAPNAAEPFLFCGEVRQGADHVQPWTDLQIDLQARRLTMMGLRTARRIVIRGRAADGTLRTVVCDQRRIVEHGPFYQRYLSVWTLDGVPQGLGTSEYMRADRLGSAWIQPFLRLPFFRHV